jgi:hypothetical protein
MPETTASWIEDPSEATAVIGFVASGGHQISIQGGDALSISHSIAAMPKLEHDEQHNGQEYAYLAWLKGKNHRTGEQGIFPTSFVKRRYDPANAMTNRRAIKVRMDPIKNAYTKRALKEVFSCFGDVERVVGMSKSGKTAIIIFHDAEAASASAKKNYQKEGGAILQVTLGGQTVALPISKLPPVPILTKVCRGFVLVVRKLGAMLGAMLGAIGRFLVRYKWLLLLLLYCLKWVLCCRLALLVFKLFGRTSKGLAAVSLILLPPVQVLDTFVSLERSAPAVVWAFDFIADIGHFLHALQEQRITGVDLHAACSRVLLSNLRWYGLVRKNTTPLQLGAELERKSFLLFHFVLRATVHLLEAAIALTFTGYAVPTSAKLSVIGAEHQTVRPRDVPCMLYARYIVHV